jgi:tetratricopeptide (TPR) repeat protein
MVDALPWTGASSQALWLYEQGIELEVNDFGAWGKLGLKLFDGRHYQESLRALERVEPLARDVDSIWYFVGLAWQGMLNDLLGRRDAALDFYRRALSVEGNPSMHHSQFGLTIDRLWVEKRLQTPFRWP